MAEPPLPPPLPPSPASAGAIWWRFRLPGQYNSTGIHSVRVKNIGTPVQEVFIDGAPLEAPEGTLAFTGPGGCYLELRPGDTGDGTWFLLLDGHVVEDESSTATANVYAEASSEDPSVAWWKFTLPDRIHQVASTHQVRVKFPGQATQEILVDGSPLDAPPGTMAFTGPLGTLLELQRRDGEWCLVVDGQPANRFNPNAGATDPPLVWRFGEHVVRVFKAGAPDQEVQVDGQLLPAPPGTTLFTGPGGALLELKQVGGTGWALAVEGNIVQEEGGFLGCGEGKVWTVMAPRGGLRHVVHVRNIGSENQEVCIDGAPLLAPPGTTMFTGPGGALLELRRSANGLDLLVDGLQVDDHNHRLGLGPHRTAAAAAPLQAPPPPPPAAASAEYRQVVSADQPLPQGVSLDAETGLYSATAKHAGRFICLGKFQTPNEAHARYMEHKSQHP